MIDNFFSSQFSSTIYQMLFRLLEKYADENGLNVGESSESNTSNTTSASQFDDLIEQASKKYGVNPNLVKAVIRAESSFDSDAVSVSGAEGLMQLMPSTASWLGVTDSMDPQQNINAGTRYLAQLLQKYDGDVQLALAAYNAGPGTVDSYGGIPPYAETQTYVNRVLEYAKSENTWSV
jgi:soluble lytic murein transglycosylase-like protein